MKSYKIDTDIFADFQKGEIVTRESSPFHKQTLESNPQWFKMNHDAKWVPGQWVITTTGTVGIVRRSREHSVMLDIYGYTALQEIPSRRIDREAFNDEILKSLKKRAENRGFLHKTQYEWEDGIGIYHEPSLVYDKRLNALCCDYQKQPVDLVWTFKDGWAEVVKRKIRDYAITPQPDDNNMVKIGCEVLNKSLLSTASELCSSHDILIILEGEDITEDIIENF